jgi:hypothetical protein
MAMNDIWKVLIVTANVPNFQVGINTLYFVEGANTGAGTDAPGMALTFSTAIAALYKAVMPGTATYRGVSAQKLALAPLAPAPSITLAGVGTAAGNSAPNQVAAVLSLRTAFAGKKFRGRSYIAFPPISFSDVNGDMTAAAQTAYLALGVAILTPFIAVGGAGTSVMSLCVRGTNLPRPVPPLRPTYSYTTVNSVQMALKWGTIRRRGQFGRLNALPF